MSIKAVFFAPSLLVLVCVTVVNSRKIIINEDTLYNTCQYTCETIPEIFDKEGCKKISGCKTSSWGWIRGFVRCDYCNCDCEEDTDDRDTVVEKKPMSVTEYELFGRCTGYQGCAHSGLVRTDYKDCQRIEDCTFARKDLAYGNGLVCELCTCQCVNERYAQKYTLKNVNYEIVNAVRKKGNPIALSDSITVKNNGSEPQSVTRVLSYTDSETTSLDTGKTLQHGLTVSVEASAEIPLVAKFGTSVSNALTTGFSQSASETNVTQKMDQIRATVTVNPYSSVKCTAVGYRTEVDIPYTADLVTTYSDGKTTSKPINGTYKNVDSKDVFVQYGEQLPLKKET